MKLKVCGAAKTVTGSSHLLTLDDGTKILLDCGLYQGREDALEDFNKEWLFDPKEIDYLILSHAHIDHCGRIPKLVKDGFKGDIICTSATRDLAAIMLLDSAFIQERDAEYASKKLKKKVEPLYEINDARVCMFQYIGLSYNRWFNVTKDVQVMFKDAGHILGSASVRLKITSDPHHTKYFGFTGDIGRPDRPILKDPNPIDQVDYLICESTYGGKKHHERKTDEENFLKIIKETCVQNRGKLIVPAFSVGRTQEIVYMLDQMESSGKLPKIPVYVDSPLAINATEIFKLHPECYDEDILKYMAEDSNPFGWNHLTYVRKVEKSKAINASKEPCVIISASGMMNAGRVKHHIFNSIENPKNTILIVGYCAPYTLGGHLATMPATAKIFGQEKKVKARIEIINSFSAHGDQSEMITFLSKQDRNQLKQIFLVHGEPNRQKPFKEALETEGFKKIEIPNLGQVYNL